MNLKNRINKIKQGLLFKLWTITDRLLLSKLRSIKRDIKSDNVSMGVAFYKRIMKKMDYFQQRKTMKVVIMPGLVKEKIQLISEIYKNFKVYSFVDKRSTDPIIIEEVIKKKDLLSKEGGEHPQQLFVDEVTKEMTLLTKSSNHVTYRPGLMQIEIFKNNLFGMHQIGHIVKVSETQYKTIVDDLKFKEATGIVEEMSLDLDYKLLEQMTRKTFYESILANEDEIRIFFEARAIRMHMVIPHAITAVAQSCFNSKASYAQVQQAQSLAIDFLAKMANTNAEQTSKIQPAFYSKYLDQIINVEKLLEGKKEVYAKEDNLMMDVHIANARNLLRAITQYPKQPFFAMRKMIAETDNPYGLNESAVASRKITNLQQIPIHNGGVPKVKIKKNIMENKIIQKDSWDDG